MNEPEPIEMLECPFCGERSGDIGLQGNTPACYCMKCKAWGPARDGLIAAVEAWNIRREV